MFITIFLDDYKHLMYYNISQEEFIYKIGDNYTLNDTLYTIIDLVVKEEFYKYETVIYEITLGNCILNIN